MIVAAVLGVALVVAPSPDVAFRAMDSCFVVRAGDALGTGFVVEGGLIVTAAHVVGDADRVLLESGARPAETQRASVVYTNALHDVAVIRSDAPVTWQPLELETVLPVAGAEVFAVGSPIGQLIASRGNVVGVTAYGIEATTPVDPGSSGGPLIDDQGRVIGVVIAQTEFSDNAIAAPVTLIREALEAAEDVTDTTGHAAEESSSTVEPWVAGVAIAALIAALVALVLSVWAVVTSHRRVRNRIVVTLDKE
ncbi:MAG: serine protease Do [Actinomycetota bacterium]|nr:serine protease Do [Actinomycetota bacterium]